VSEKENVRENVARLIAHFRQGDGDRKPLSQRGLAKRIGVSSQKTIWSWEHGKTDLDSSSREKLANFLGKTESDLASYLRSEITLEEFLDGIKIPRNRQMQQILQWLPALKPAELFEVLQEGFRLLSAHFGLAPPAFLEPKPVLIPVPENVSISDLIRAHPDHAQLCVDAEISPERLQELIDGARPCNHELVLLSVELTKPDGKNWKHGELRKIRDLLHDSEKSTYEETTNAN
jgi:transcriptional regulator with XRE-family HTH domain